MEVDFFHAIIEKTKQKSFASIVVKRNWVNLIRTIRLLLLENIINKLYFF